MAEDFEGAAPSGTTLRDVAADAFIAEFAAFLKKQGKLELPKWVDYAKTGIQRELAPLDPDWFYVRTASVARKVYLRPGIGIGALRRQYGGANRRPGCHRQHFTKSSGSVISTAMEQLQKLGFVEVAETRGRRITRAGQQALDRVAGQVMAKATA